MGTDTTEPTTSKSGQTDEDDVDTVRALAEAYARIEYVEGHIDMDLCADELETAKTAIGKTHAVMFDAEVEHAHRELRDGVGTDKWDGVEARARRQKIDS